MDFSELVHIFKPHENLLNSSSFEYSNLKSIPTGYYWLYSNLILLNTINKNVYNGIDITDSLTNQVSIHLFVHW